MLKDPFHVPNSFRIHQILSTKAGIPFEETRYTIDYKYFELRGQEKVVGVVRDRRGPSNLLRMVGVCENALAAITQTSATRYSSFTFFLHPATSITAGNQEWRVSIHSSPPMITGIRSHVRQLLTLERLFCGFLRRRGVVSADRVQLVLVDHCPW